MVLGAVHVARGCIQRDRRMSAEAGAGWSLEAYRPYLLVLANLQLDPRLRGKLEAADVVQETLLRAHKHQAECVAESEEARRGWLRKILVNVMLELARRFQAEQRNLAREVSLEEAVEKSSARMEAWLCDGQSSPSQRAQRNEEVFGLAAALLRLPEEQRQAVELRYLQGCSVEEVATQLGRSRAAAAGLLRRGLAALRDLLA